MIELNSVSKWYGQHQVLNDCSASIGRGEVVVICGPSGSGKSTLIKTINGLETVQRGQIVVNGIDVLDLRVFEIDSRPERLDHRDVDVLVDGG